MNETISFFVFLLHLENKNTTPDRK